MHSNFRFSLLSAFLLMAGPSPSLAQALVPSPVYFNHEPQGRHHVLILGDSITRSNCDEDSHGLCGWREFLAEACGKRPDYYTIDTLSQSGRTASAFAEELPKLSFLQLPVPFIAETRYEAVFILLGINDIGNGQGNELPLLKSHIQGIVNSILGKTQKPAPTIELLSVLPSCAYNEESRPRTALKVLQYNRFLKMHPHLGNYVDLYSEAVQWKTLGGKTVGCLSPELDRGDHVHPKLDKKIQKKLARWIAEKSDICDKSGK